MQEIIKLNTIMWNDKSGDGTWCYLPYPNHPNGCPNFPVCVNEEQSNYNSITKLAPKSLQWYAVIEEFNLEEHMAKMKTKFPNWSDAQCKCVLYWQSSVRKKLREKTQRYCKELNGCYYTLCPEALGINIFGTMAKHGLILYKNPKLVRKIAFIGIIKQ